MAGDETCRKINNYCRRQRYQTADREHLRSAIDYASNKQRFPPQQCSAQDAHSTQRVDEARTANTSVARLITHQINKGSRHNNALHRTRIPHNVSPLSVRLHRVKGTR
ncbi:hypothetical protein J6590_059982 [Homalodisca vitripennis]|nr:hypothetical protein J6590_059982 [Homalodisca vitripennis]